MFIDPPPPPPPFGFPPGLLLHGRCESTVTGPRCAPAAYAQTKITTSSSRKPHSFVAWLTGPSPSLFHPSVSRPA